MPVIAEGAPEDGSIKSMLAQASYAGAAAAKDDYECGDGDRRGGGGRGWL